MAITMDMLSVLKLSKQPGMEIPSGLKVIALTDPNAGPAPVSPVLAIGGFTFWPMSYDDNRMSFGMVMYDPSWSVVNVIEKKGARYIYQITLAGSGTNGTVTFAGQDNKSVQMAVADFAPLMLDNSIQAQ